MVLILGQHRTAQAHPADMYIHHLDLTLTPQGLLLGWEIRPGPMLASWLWYEADQDEDESISMAEALAWGQGRAALLSAGLDGTPFPLELEEVQFPAGLNEMQASSAPIILKLSAPWSQDGKAAHRLSLRNGMEESKSVNWFTVKAVNESAFHQPIQQGNQIDVDLIRSRDQADNPANLLTS